MATEVVRIVDPDQGAGYHYASLKLWEDDFGDTTTGHLINNDQIAIAQCRSTGGTADTTAVSILGWTTDATRYIEIRTTGNARHLGKWDSGKYRLSVADAVALDIRANYVRLDGMQVELSSATATRTVVNLQGIAASNDIRITDCIIRGHSNSSYSSTIVGPGDTDIVLSMANCVIHGPSGNGSDRGMSITAATCYIYNVTIKVASGTGIRNFAGTCNCKNVAVVAGGSFTTSGGTINRDYCVTNDGGADDNGGTGNQVSITESSMAFADASATDFHIGPRSSLRRQGTSLAADANFPFSDDIDGMPRRGAWDIGADQARRAKGGLQLVGINTGV